MLRQSRKQEHIKYTLMLEDGPRTSGFEDVSFIHNCLPEIAYDDVDVRTNLCGIPLMHPIIINAITGGAPDVKETNSMLARLAKATKSVIAVGSQYAAIENPDMEDTYSVVRDIYPDGIIFANLGAYAEVDDAKRAVEMIDADALQIHLNVAQEMTMREGDRNFYGYLRKIKDIVEAVKIPVIVKEVGCGIALEQARLLAETGVQAIDVGGGGGTNFMAIEAARLKGDIADGRLNWGLPTVISALEVKEVLPPEMFLIVSGGVRSALDIVKSLAFGASAAAVAGGILKMLHHEGLDYTVDWVTQTIADLKSYMLMTGARNITALNKVPMVISGSTWHWLNERGIDTKKYAQRYVNR